MAKKIAIQGFEGSFHQAAAWQYWGKDTQVLPCATFRQVVAAAEDKAQCDGAVMAIENSIAGSILPNYDLLQKSNLSVIGEVHLAIKQQLLVNPGVKLEDIHEVHSHPMAILQCLDFLDQYPHWKIIEATDTALSAQYIQRGNSKNIAAIASTLAAEMFGLDVLASDIHTQEHNYTRFLILEPRKDAPTIRGADKASVYFQVGNEKGSLADVLQLVATAGINLSKLQSFPIPGSNWLYGFHADMEFDTILQLEKIITDLQNITELLNVYGVYKRGN